MTKVHVEQPCPSRISPETHEPSMLVPITSSPTMSPSALNRKPFMNPFTQSMGPENRFKEKNFNLLIDFFTFFVLFQDPKSPTELVTSPVTFPSDDLQYNLTPFRAESSLIQLSGCSSSTFKSYPQIFCRVSIT